MDQEKVDYIAGRINKRRKLVSALPKEHAYADAMMFVRYGIEPSVDHFKTGMTLALRDKSNRLVTLHYSKSGRFSVRKELVDTFDVIVMASGEFDQVELRGWMSDAMLIASPHLQIRDSWKVEITSDFLLPMPEELDFEMPDFSRSLKLWDHGMGAWLVEGGYMLHDEEFRLDLKYASPG